MSFISELEENEELVEFEETWARLGKIDAIVSELNENSGTFAGWSAISRELDKEAEELTDILEDKEGYLNE
jgi:hypothetical protein